MQAEPAELLNIAYKNLLASKTQLLSDEEKENSAGKFIGCVYLNVEGLPLLRHSSKLGSAFD